MKNVLEYLDKSVCDYPQNIFIEDENNKITFLSFNNNTDNIGTFLLKKDITGSPVLIISEKNSQCLEMAFGAVKAGCFYTIADSKMPIDRIKKIIALLSPKAILCDSHNKELSLSLKSQVPVYEYSLLVQEEKDSNLLFNIRKRQTDSDVLYVLFTSGSTGEPKGVTITHRAVIAYTAWVTAEFKFDVHTVFGSQTPFYFSMSVTDIFSAMSSAARLVIIPKALFSFPTELINYLNDKMINTIYWVPTALGIVANFDALSVAMPKYLKTVLFAGEVMPTKKLLYWQEHLDDSVEFANLFGPTESTDICLFYIVNRKLKPTDTVPIGNACDNCKALIIDENGKESNKGELYIGGSFLASGYYNNIERTKESFVQNPLTNAYNDILYRTGDIVMINKYGETEYIGRRDFQIKHLGYRIELGEIESTLSVCDKVKNLACVYDKDSDSIICTYEGSKELKDTLPKRAEELLLSYMRPDTYLRCRSLPINQNGKLDRKQILIDYLKNK